MLTQGVAPDGVLNALTRSGGIVQDEQMVDDLTKIRDLYRREEQKVFNSAVPEKDCLRGSGARCEP